MAVRFMTKRPTIRKVVRPRPNSSVPHKLTPIEDAPIMEAPEIDAIVVTEPVVEEAPKTTARKAKARKAAPAPKTEEIVEEINLAEEESNITE